MIVYHWFRKVEKILEAMEIISDATKIKLNAFQLEGESQIWWDWIKASRDVEAMTWEGFRELFRSKFFPSFARHAQTRGFLKLRREMMTMLEYMAKFTKLAHFTDDYVATDMAKVRKFLGWIETIHPG